jgi:hypothetical protein
MCLLDFYEISSLMHRPDKCISYIMEIGGGLDDEQKS